MKIKTAVFFTFFCLFSAMLMGQKTEEKNLKKTIYTDYLKSPKELNIGHNFLRKPLLRKENSLRIKSSAGIKQKLDSVLAEEYDTESSRWYYSLKLTYKFDKHNNPSQYTYYSRDKDNKTLMVESMLKTADSSWTPSDKSEYTFDSNNNKIQEMQMHTGKIIIR